jgi:Acyl-CoA synthetases (AMP-forming)/AMP-acid ligases II
LATPVEIPDLLRRGLAGKADELALVSPATQRTWRDVEAATDRLAARLLGLGLKPGDRVASLMPNRTALIVHYLGCLKAGLVITPLNYRYMPPEIDHALEVSGASILLAHAERDGDLAESRLAGTLPLGRISFEATPDGTNRTLEALLAEPAPKMALPRPAAGDPAVILFTSGSTGKPKGVTHTFETLGWMIASVIESFQLTSDDLMLPGSSISHIGGLLLSLAALAAGARVDVARTFDGHELLTLLRTTRPTVLSMLPAALFALVRDHDARREDFASLRYCLSGGDKVSAELEREFTDVTGFPISEGYGMTEIGLSTMTPVKGPNKLGSVGRMGVGYEASIRSATGGESAPGVEGRLWVRSPATMVGYWNRPDATAETIRDGWLDTGDVMKADDDGYLWFCGRQKQIIIHDGSNICPQEVEEALLVHPAVELAAVIGIHDPVHGENVRAYVTLLDGAERPTAQALIRCARDQVGYKAPEEIVILDEMPINPTGKVDRVRLKRWAAEGTTSST